MTVSVASSVSTVISNHWFHSTQYTSLKSIISSHKLSLSPLTSLYTLNDISAASFIESVISISTAFSFPSLSPFFFANTIVGACGLLAASKSIFIVIKATSLNSNFDYRGVCQFNIAWQRELNLVLLFRKCAFDSEK